MTEQPIDSVATPTTLIEWTTPIESAALQNKGEKIWGVHLLRRRSISV